jgi:Ca2+-binding RTX toxin-like protein
MRRAILMVATMALTVLVASGVALAVTKIGTDGPDTLRGTNGADNLLGLGGNDRLYSLRGNDNLLGGSGKDVVWGENNKGCRCPLGGNKNLYGGSGLDFVSGGSGSDNVVGGGGDDFMGDGEFEHAVKDNLFGGAGNDGINVANKPGVKDVVACGSGFDRVLADRKDVVAPDCERVFVGWRNEEAFFASFPQSFIDSVLELL